MLTEFHSQVLSWECKSRQLSGRVGGGAWDAPVQSLRQLAPSASQATAPTILEKKEEYLVKVGLLNMERVTFLLLLNTSQGHFHFGMKTQLFQEEVRM